MGTLRKGSLETLKFKKWKIITLRGVAGNTKVSRKGKWAHLEGSLETLKWTMGTLRGFKEENISDIDTDSVIVLWNWNFIYHVTMYMARVSQLNLKKRNLVYNWGLTKNYAKWNVYNADLVAQNFDFHLKAGIINLYFNVNLFLWIFFLSWKYLKKPNWDVL